MKRAKSETTTTNQVTLSNDVWTYMFAMMGPKDRTVLYKVCQDWNQLANLPCAWPKRIKLESKPQVEWALQHGCRRPVSLELINTFQPKIHSYFPTRWATDALQVLTIHETNPACQVLKIGRDFPELRACRNLTELALPSQWVLHMDRETLPSVSLKRLVAGFIGASSLFQWPKVETLTELDIHWRNECGFESVCPNLVRICLRRTWPSLPEFSGRVINWACKDTLRVLQLPSQECNMATFETLFLPLVAQNKSTLQEVQLPRLLKDETAFTRGSSLVRETLAQLPHLCTLWVTSGWMDKQLLPLWIQSGMPRLEALILYGSWHDHGQCLASCSEEMHLTKRTQTLQLPGLDALNTWADAQRRRRRPASLTETNNCDVLWIVSHHFPECDEGHDCMYSQLMKAEDTTGSGSELLPRD